MADNEENIETLGAPRVDLEAPPPVGGEEGKSGEVIQNKALIEGEETSSQDHPSLQAEVATPEDGIQHVASSRESQQGEVSEPVAEGNIHPTEPSVEVSQAYSTTKIEEHPFGNAIPRRKPKEPLPQPFKWGVSKSGSSTSGRHSSLRSTFPPSHQRSQLGPQTESYKRTEPNAAFGRSKRFDDVVFISHAHMRVLQPRGMPGPGTYELTKFGKVQKEKGAPGDEAAEVHHASFDNTEPRFRMQTLSYEEAGRKPGPGEYPGALAAPVSNKQQLAPIGFTTGTRIQFPSRGFETTFYGCMSPGPIYLPNQDKCQWKKGAPLIGPPTEDTHKVSTTASRAKLPTQHTVPGPGTYDAPSTDLVRGLQAGKGGFGFGTAPRGHMTSVSLTPAQASKLLAGMANEKGPGAYNVKVNTASRIKNSPAFAFGGCTRFPDVRQTAPGPGSYCV